MRASKAAFSHQVYLDGLYYHKIRIEAGFEGGARTVLPAILLDIYFHAVPIGNLAFHF